MGCIWVVIILMDVSNLVGVGSKLLAYNSLACLVNT